MQEIVNNPWIYEVAYLDLYDSSLKYETPSRAYDQGEKEVWEVELDDGSVIKATPDHKFLSNGEWKTLKEIIEKELDISVKKIE
jgi:DNA polymerase-3 subunit alpha